MDRGRRTTARCQNVSWSHYRELLEVLKLFKLKIIGIWCHHCHHPTMIHDFITPRQWVKSFYLGDTILSTGVTKMSPVSPINSVASYCPLLDFWVQPVSIPLEKTLYGNLL